MKTCNEWADYLSKRLAQEFKKLPNGFFDSFEYTSTGNNLCHSFAWGIIAKILWETPGISAVGIDVRLNNGGTKIQPDVVGFSDVRTPVVFIDYESPNSSDVEITDYH